MEKEPKQSDKSNENQKEVIEGPVVSPNNLEIVFVEDLETAQNNHNQPQLFESISHKVNYIEACAIIIILSIIPGILQGYPESLEIIIMSKGASFSDQALLSLNQYPFLLKIFFVPFLDMYYFKRLGKSKTLISISGIILFFILFFFGSESEHYLENLRVVFITGLWFVITIFCVIFQIGTEI